MTNHRANAMQGIANLLPRLDDPDPDIRFMQLNDLAAILNGPGSESLRNETHAAARVIDRLIKALTDSNGEVQNQALKWYISQLSHKYDANLDTALGLLLSEHPMTTWHRILTRSPS